MNRLFVPGAILLAAYAWGTLTDRDTTHSGRPDEFVTSASMGGSVASTSSRILGEAFNRGTSNLQVEGSGIVTRMLADDNNGSRHQRFIIELLSGQTLLVAHNIDLAPRIGAIRQGDQIDFFGEYEWNSQGGVIHWTHEDPRGEHVAGWLRHNGRIYQ